MIDDEISAFLALHPKGTVVEIGCGLNTRFDRLDNGTVRWFDLDLPDTIALRRKFFEDRDRNTMISSSILDPDWISAVHSAGGPWCFVSEAVLIYLEEDEVRRVFSTISEHFEGAWIVTDTTSRAMVDGQSRHDVMRHLPPQSWFRWACDDPRELEGWGVGVRLTRSRTFLDASPNLLRQLPVVLQLLARFVPRFILKGIRGYKLNRFVVSEGRGATPSGGRVSVEW